MQIQKKHLFAIFLFSLFLFLLIASGHCGEGITARGIAAVRVVDTDTNGAIIPESNISFDFTVSVCRDGRWAIKSDSLQEKDTIYMTFDGADTYFVRYQEAVLGMENGKIQKLEKKPINQQINTAYVSSGNYPFAPHDDLKRGNLLWLIYGAGNYIHDLKTNTMPLPWVPARWGPLAFGFRFEAELTTGFPFFPHYIRFIRDTSLDLPDDDEMKRPELDGKGVDWILHLMGVLQERKKKFPNGYLRGEVKVSIFTNLNGIEFPMKFSFIEHRPMSDIETLSTYLDGQVTSVSDLDSNEMFYPPILGTLSVADTRFRYQDATHKIDGINYGLRVGEKWKQSASPDLQEHYREDIAYLPASIRPMPSELKQRRLITMGIFLIVVLFLPLFLYKTAIRKKKFSSRSDEQTTNNNNK